MRELLSPEKLAPILKQSRSQEAEIVAIDQKSSLTRFSNSQIHQSMSEENSTLWMRAVERKRVGLARANQPDAQTGRYLAEKAATNAEHAPVDEQFPGLTASEPISDSSKFDEPTAMLGPEERADIASAMIARAKAAGMAAAGSVSSGRFSLSVLNTLGTSSSALQSEISVSILVSKNGASGYAQFHSNSAAELDPVVLSDRAIDKARAALSIQEVKPGRWDVILEPLAVADMIGFLAYIGLGALSLQERRSFMYGRLGEQIVDPSITLTDDAFLPGLPSLPFDFEGVPKQKVSLITRGVAQAVVYDSYTAARENKKSTGHAMPPGSAVGPLPTSLVLSAGTVPLANMLQSSEKVILVTRFHYTNIEDPLAALYTGMTRDGTFLMEGGRIVSGLKNLRFTQSILEALSNVHQVSRETEIVEGILGPCSVPYLYIKDFNITGASR